MYCIDLYYTYIIYLKEVSLFLKGLTTTSLNKYSTADYTYLTWNYRQDNSSQFFTASVDNIKHPGYKLKCKVKFTS